MKPIKLTVFTEPIAAEGFFQRIKAFVRPLKYLLQGKKIPQKKKYGGHYAVTRSLVEGLQKIGADFNYNPTREKDIAENVIVLSDVQRLREMIELKKTGKIGLLLAGPNVVEDVRSEGGIVAHPAVDYYVVPSEWVKDLVIKDCKNLKGRVLCWHGGIDSQNWQPSTETKDRNNVLIYWKTEPEKFCENVVELVRGLGTNPTVIQYGKYNVREYKKQLDKSRFAIFISRSESQGIALAEAWSMNVPTLVFDPGDFFFTGRTINNVSACPYLTNETGLAWKNLDDLKRMITDKNLHRTFAPRAYVLRQFTDEYSANQLISVLNK